MNATTRLLLVLAAGVLALATGGLAADNGSNNGSSNVGGAVATPPTSVPSIPMERTPGGLEAEKQIPHGPADPVYREPIIPGGSPSLAITASGGYRQRGWAVRTSYYSNGVLVHMPRWFADPLDDLGATGPIRNATLCEDVCASLYSPARFLANLFALPVTMVMHPICKTEVTDRSAVEAQAESEIVSTPREPAIAPAPRDPAGQTPASQPAEE